jgi:chorismate synthase
LLKENKKLLEEYLNNIFSFYIKDSNKQDINFPKKKINEIFLTMDENYLKMYENIEKGNVAKIPDFSGKNINVVGGSSSSSGGDKCDFDEVLEKLHAAAMEEIEASKGAEDGSFSARLLKAIDDCEFC